MEASAVKGSARRAFAAAVGIGLSLSPIVAFACPQCASREGGGSFAAWILAGMIVLPFAVALVVLRIVRRGERRFRALNTDERRSELG